MGDGIGNLPVVSLAILAGISFICAMLLAGLMTAFLRVNGVYRNGLLEAESVGRILDVYLRSSRRLLLTVSTLYLAVTVLGCFLWGQLLIRWGADSSAWRLLLVLIVSSVLVWTLGGLCFKRLAVETALGYTRTLGTFLFPIFWLLRPWTAILQWAMEQMDDTMWTGEAVPHLSTGEIRSLLNEDAENVTLEDEEREMIQSIFSFGDTAVREIMVPRIDMVSLDGTAAIETVIPIVYEARHSRIPVHESSVDKVTGLLYAKDLLDLVTGGELVTAGKVVSDLARPAYFIPESKKIDEVLTEFRVKKIHMAIVIDEYGGTAGLVTLEDVLEEIVGEIEDEFDEEEKLFSWVDANSCQVDPKIDLEDLQELLGVTLPDEGSETLGGLIYEAAGKVPEPGDKIEVADYVVRVKEVVDQRIVLVTLTAPEPLPGFTKQ